MAEKLKIQKGKKEVFSIMLKYEDQTPYNLAGMTEIVVSFVGQEDGSTVTAKFSDSEITVLSACAGKFMVEMGGLKTKLIKAGEDLNFQVNIIKNSDVDNPDIIQFRERLDVSEDLFPS